jgi:hypothetical protein
MRAQPKLRRNRSPIAHYRDEDDIIHHCILCSFYDTCSGIQAHLLVASLVVLRVCTEHPLDHSSGLVRRGGRISWSF